MKIKIISYHDLKHKNIFEKIEHALLQHGVVGVAHVPLFVEKSRSYIDAVRAFAALPDDVKKRYMPNRDQGDTEGYELGAEQFKNQQGVWQVDDKKASYYAYIPDQPRNKWPLEVNLRTPFLELGDLIYHAGQLLLHALGLNESVGLKNELLIGQARMLHYHKENDQTNFNPNWCGAHCDHGLFTGLIPAYYFQHGKEIDEPDEAGLYVASENNQFEKVHVPDQSILLFQVGEFAQLILNDRIRATKHVVKKTKEGVERFTFALFYSVHDDVVIQSKSVLTHDGRYRQHQFENGSISYGAWQNASLSIYRAR